MWLRHTRRMQVVKNAKFVAGNSISPFRCETPHSQIFYARIQPGVCLGSAALPSKHFVNRHKTCVTSPDYCVLTHTALSVTLAVALSLAKGAVRVLLAFDKLHRDCSGRRPLLSGPGAITAAKTMF